MECPFRRSWQTLTFRSETRVAAAKRVPALKMSLVSSALQEEDRTSALVILIRRCSRTSLQRRILSSRLQASREERKKAYCYHPQPREREQEQERQRGQQRQHALTSTSPLNPPRHHQSRVEGSQESRRGSKFSRTLIRSQAAKGSRGLEPQQMRSLPSIEAVCDGTEPCPNCIAEEADRTKKEGRKTFSIKRADELARQKHNFDEVSTSRGYGGVEMKLITA